MALVALVSCSGDNIYDREIDRELKELDRCIQVRKVLEEEKQIRIKSLTASLGDRTLSPSSRLTITSYLAAEYGTYCFDSLVFYLEQEAVLADMTGNRDIASSSRIRLATALASCGHYLEANEMLSKIDTAGFSHELYREYYKALYIFADACEEQAQSLGEYRLIGSSSDYLEKYLSYGDPGTGQWKFYRLRLYMLNRNYTKAEKAADELLETFPKGSGDYAFTAFYKSIICDCLLRDKDRLLWAIRAAQSDMLSMNKNYSALTMVASELSMTQPARAFEYIQLSLGDGLFYSGILRPWQISRVLPDIQTSFKQNQIKHQRHTLILNIIFIILIIVLALSLFTIFKSYREQKKLRLELEGANDVREQYIAQFLVRQSDWIDRLKSFQLSIIKKLRYGKTEDVVKELSMSDDVDREIKIFYEDFDNTFLALFPTFIEDFCNLLQDKACIGSLGQNGSGGGRAMNTELRIYALVRLGIDDSNEIARLLKYSVRTIYNYKVKIVNSAKGSKEDFEKAVKMIGRQHSDNGNGSTFTP